MPINMTGMRSVWLLSNRAVAERQTYAKDGKDVNVMGWQQRQL